MKIVLDAGRMTDKQESHQYLKEQFGFQDYYGGNLDAFHDCLMELEEVEIVIENQDEAGAYFHWVLRVLEEAAKEEANIQLTNIPMV